MLVLACALGCGRGTRHVAPDAGAKRDLPSSSATASSASSPVASERAPIESASTAPSEAPEHHAVDPAFDAFEERVRAACTPKEVDGTMAEMAGNVHATGRCLYLRLSALAKALPKATQHALAVGDRRELDTDIFSPSWGHLVDAACGLDDAARWVTDVSREAGTMRYVEAPSCSNDSLLEGIYLLESLRKSNGAQVFAERVRATAAEGNKRLAALPAVRSSLERLRGVAHDDALFDDECFHCHLSDADWRRLLLDVDLILEESSKLAHALCGVWPELAAELGGTDHCEAPVRAHFAWYLASVPAPFGAGAGREAYVGYPPPKDAAYRAYVDPLTDSCRRGESLHYSSDEFERRVLACLRRRGQPEEQHRKIQRALERYVERLCEVEASVSRTSVGPITDVHTKLANRVKDIQCPELSAQRVAYVLSSLTSHSVEAFAKHVRGRIPWAVQIRAGATRVRAIAAMAECKDYFDVFDGTCRSPALKAGEWRKLDRELADLPAAALLPARALCGSWPELSTEFGGERCEQNFIEYFLSYGMFVGLAAQPSK